MAPLGKLLRLDSAKDLNDLLREEQGGDYEGYVLDQSLHARQFLLTTARTRKESYLFGHSAQLQRLQNPGKQNYVLVPTLPRYDPPGLQSQRETEIPHEYLRPHVDKLYVL